MCFPNDFVKFLEHIFYKTPFGDCFLIYEADFYFRNNVLNSRYFYTT